MPLRVGSVPYLVARPLTFGLEAEPGIELVQEVPSRLVERLREGSLDVALASSVELFRRDGYRILPSHGIVADGEVWSVKLYSRRPLPAVRSVSLDVASRSAAALVRALLAAWTPHRIEYRDLPAGADGAGQGTDAFLRVGDVALAEAAPAGFEEVDLARAWKELTGFPIVFALWIVRPGADLGGLEKAFVKAARRGLKERPALAEAAATASGLPADLLRKYLCEVCRYDLKAPGVMEGLLAFRDRAAAAGACRGDLKVRNYRAPSTAASKIADDPETASAPE